MDEQPLISVVIPTYNRAEMIERAIQSVQNQTYQHLEIIVVDDCSTDNTIDILKNLQKKDSRIKFHRFKSNQGANICRNKGIESSTGNYIALLDSDDEWLPTKLDKQINIFIRSKNARLGLVYSGVIIVQNGRETKRSPSNSKRGPVNDSNLIYSWVNGLGSCALIRKDVFDKCGLFDTSEELRWGGSQDTEMEIRIGKKFDFDFFSEPLIKAYVHKKSITHQSLHINPFFKIHALFYIWKKNIDFFSKSITANKIYTKRITKLLLQGRKYEATKKIVINCLKNELFYLEGYYFLVLSLILKRAPQLKLLIYVPDTIRTILKLN